MGFGDRWFSGFDVNVCFFFDPVPSRFLATLVVLSYSLFVLFFVDWVTDRKALVAFKI